MGPRMKCFRAARALRRAVLSFCVTGLVAILVSCSQPADSTPPPQTGSEVITLAGKAGEYGTTDATGSAARFYLPWGIATDGTNLYVADSENHTIRQIVISTGVVSTLAGTAGSSGSDDSGGTYPKGRFNSPRGVAVDAASTNLYVADTSNNMIRQVVISSGTVTTLAGQLYYGSTDAAGTEAKFHFPHGITILGENLYVADTFNHTIRQIVISTAAVTTLAGQAGMSGSDDSGAAFLKGRFKAPHDITTDGTGLFVADTYNHTIRAIVIPGPVVGTIAGQGFYKPCGITSDGTDIYVADSYSHRIRKVSLPSLEVTTVAGSYQGSSDGRGSGAHFNCPLGITTAGSSLYVADTFNYTIRVVAK